MMAADTLAPLIASPAGGDIGRLVGEADGDLNIWLAAEVNLEHLEPDFVCGGWRVFEGGFRFLTSREWCRCFQCSRMAWLRRLLWSCSLTKTNSGARWTSGATSLPGFGFMTLSRP